MKKLVGLLLGLSIFGFVHAQEHENEEELEVVVHPWVAVGNQLIRDQAVRLGMNNEQIEALFAEIREEGQGVPVWFLRGNLQRPDVNNDQIIANNQRLVLENMNVQRAFPVINRVMDRPAGRLRLGREARIQRGLFLGQRDFLANEFNNLAVQENRNLVGRILFPPNLQEGDNDDEELARPLSPDREDDNNDMRD